MLETEDRLIRTSELPNYVPYHRTRIMQMVADGSFPAPLKLSSRRLCWRLSDVRSWIAQQATAA